MSLKDMLGKIQEMDPKDLELIIECGVILTKLDENEQDKILEMLDVLVKLQKKKFLKSTKEGCGKFNNDRTIALVSVTAIDPNLYSGIIPQGLTLTIS